MTTPRNLTLLIVLALLIAPAFAPAKSSQPAVRHSASDRVKMHEWGTFTCLQDETGRSLRGINTDDEPVPRFVHQLADRLLLNPTDVAPVYFKGVPGLHPDVLMRLETPVMYFYPPRGGTLPMKLDVQVDFRGGWLSEYYPDAKVHAPGFWKWSRGFGKIKPDIKGSLIWKDLTLTDDLTAGPKTDERVWLAPREVASASVVTPKGQEERYLFYRGVGNLTAPLRISRVTQKGKEGASLQIRSQLDPKLGLGDAMPIKSLWLVHVREDGQVAYRTLDPVTVTSDSQRVLTTTPASFNKAQYAPDNLERLRDDMRKALIADGLFTDEADAMLNTWELAYFKSEGMRVFFLLPQTWTDAVLPVTLSQPADISRTMVGRIELITPRHRELLDKLSKLPPSETGWLHGALQRSKLSSTEHRRLYSGHARMKNLRVKMPADYRTYLELGRFRNALLLDRIERQGTASLSKFADTYKIKYFEPEK